MTGLKLSIHMKIEGTNDINEDIISEIKNYIRKTLIKTQDLEIK